MSKITDAVKSIVSSPILLAGVLLAGAWSASASAQTAVVLLDGSGSMQGFARTGSLWDLGERLCHEVERRGASCRQLVFTSRTEDGEDFELLTVEDFRAGSRKWGSRTHLDLAFANADPAADILFVVTDNVHSAENKELDEGILDFYRAFRSDEVRRAMLAPTRENFDGLVYLPFSSSENLEELRRNLRNRGQVPGRVIQSPPELTFRYRGERALVLYAVARSPASDEILRGLEEQPQGNKIFEFVLIKGITDKEIQVAPVAEERDVLDRVGNWFDRCRGQRVESVLGANFELIREASYQGGGFRVRPKPGYPFRPKLDEKIDIVFYFSLYSRLPYLDIGFEGEEEKCEGGIELEILDSSFGYTVLGDSDFEPANPAQGFIIPPNLVGVLRAEERSEYIYYSHLELGPLVTGFWDLLRHPTLRLEITFVLQMRVPRKGFHFSRDYRTKWFTDSDLADPSRIYSPTDLIQYIYQGEDMIVIDIPFKMDQN